MRHDYLTEVADSLKEFNAGTKNYKAHVDVTVQHLINVRNKLDADIERLSTVSKGLITLSADIGPEKINPEGPTDMQGALQKTAPETENEGENGSVG